MFVPIKQTIRTFLDWRKTMGVHIRKKRDIFKADKADIAAFSFAFSREQYLKIDFFVT